MTVFAQIPQVTTIRTSEVFASITGEYRPYRVGQWGWDGRGTEEELRWGGRGGIIGVGGGLDI